ncbi:sce7726 family protein [Roseibium sp. Sym1]|uniref:sce7726 family protein n=1 Tax=Roseibium sp. Sym1 TaxID=3016006 RepID=UPI0022B2B92C|nr:sce7726 family protein [Roseibium sp. Sym1]
MRDRDVRDVVVRDLQAAHLHDPTTRIVQEMGIWSGTVRIDVATINGELSGFELKSDRDTLERLPTQAKYYGLVFDRLTLVCGSKHIEKAKKIVPKWWGIISARENNGQIILENLQEPELNKEIDPFLVAQLLWKEEAIAVLDRYNLAKGFRSKAARVIHQRMAHELPLETLTFEVRAALKSRDGWLGQPIGYQRNVPIQ